MEYLSLVNITAIYFAHRYFSQYRLQPQVHVHVYRSVRIDAMKLFNEILYLHD